MTPLLAALLLQAGIDWKTDYDAALAEAKKSGRYVHVHVWGPNCHYCEMMDQRTLPDAGVVRFSNETFINVKLGTETHGKLCQQLGVEPIPATILISPEGVKIAHWAGFLGPQQYRTLLEGGVAAHGKLKTLEPKLKESPEDPKLLAELGSVRVELGDARLGGDLYRKAAAKTKDAKERSTLLLKAFEHWNSLPGEPALNADLAALAEELDAFDPALELKDDAAYARAMVDINGEKWDQAIAKLEIVVKTWPKGDRAPASLLTQADLLHHAKEDHKAAMAKCQAVIDGFPDTPWAENAKAVLAHIKAHAGEK